MLGFALKTRGARRIPAEAELRVLVDADRDGDWDRVLYNRYAQAWDDRLPAGSWLVLVAPVQRGTLAPDEAAAKAVPGTMVYDLDETVTMLAAPAAMLGVELSAGRAVFDWGAIVLDAVGDHPLRPGYPGFDLLPDGLAGGARLRFDQRAAACLAWTDGEGRPLARVGQSLRLAAAALRAVIETEADLAEPRYQVFPGPAKDAAPLIAPKRRTKTVSSARPMSAVA